MIQVIRQAAEVIRGVSRRLVADLGRERDTCLECGSRIAQPREGRSRKYCSLACSRRYWSALRRVRA